TPDDRAQPTSAMDPAANPATSPTAPSIVIQPRLAQASQRAHLAARSHPISRCRTALVWMASLTPGLHNADIGRPEIGRASCRERGGGDVVGGVMEKGERGGV